MKPYSLSSEAQQDLEHIRTYSLKHADARVARHVAREVTAGFRFLAATPGAGHVRTDAVEQCDGVRFNLRIGYLRMDDVKHLQSAPDQWIDLLAESEEDLKAGRVVSGDAVIRDLREGLARLEARAASTNQKDDPPR